MERPLYYRDQSDWRALQRFLPSRLFLDEADAPVEDFWEWRGNTVHLDRYRAPDAPAKVILHHGVGTNGRQMTLILGAPLAGLGFETVALDNLGYGLTRVAPGTVPSYQDWVDLVTDFVAFERSRDDRPIVLFGLSAGGMLTYHVAAAAPAGAVRGIVGTTFLDQRDQRVRDATSHDIVHSRAGIPLMRLLARTPAAGFRYPMTLASKMYALVEDRDALRVMTRDKTSGGTWVSARFLATYTTYAPAVEPGRFDRCPILLTQPDADRWSPLALSERFLRHVTRVPVRTVVLEHAGHYPIEDPGLRQLTDSVAAFVTEVCG